MSFHKKYIPHLSKYIPKLAAVPKELIPYVNTVDAINTDETSPWWLAERIIVSAFEDASLEANILELLDLIRKAIDENDVLSYIFDIADSLFDIVTTVLTASTLKNMFNEDNALITVYYTTVFIVCCAFSGRDKNGDGVDDGEAMVQSIHKYDEIWVRLARLATKLLLNQQVYEFVSDVRDTKCAPLFTWARTCVHKS